MPYLINQINTIHNKNIFLLLDKYSLIDKNNNFFQTVKISDKTALYVSKESLITIKNKNSDIPCYGLWQLLHHNNIIDFKEKNKLFALYTNKEEGAGFFLYYDNEALDCYTGVIIKGEMIGLFGSTLPKITAIKIDDKMLVKNLPNEILRPLDVYKKEQYLMKVVAIYGISTISIVAGIIFVIYSIIMPYGVNIIFSDHSAKKNTIQLLERRLNRAKLDLSKLKISKININAGKEKTPLLTPLSILATLNVNYTLRAKMSDTKMQLTFKKIQSWMSKLPKEIFTISQKKDTIYIDWVEKK